MRRVGRALGLALAGLVMAGPASAKEVKFMMDWAWQGGQAFALVARKNGYFKRENVDIVLDRGFGSGRVPVEIAAGTYQMGLADLNPSIRFMAENPDRGLMAVAILGDGSVAMAAVRADGPIKAPKDFEGRTLAAPDADAGRQLFPVFAKVAGFDVSKVKWISVKPELREPMLVQRQADGITGFMNTSVPALAALGMPKEQLRIFKYKDFGAPLYGYAILTTKAFAEANPEVVKGVVRSMIEGLKDAVKDPDGAIAALKEHEPLTDTAVERTRWQMLIDDMVVTDHARKAGISVVDTVRLQQSIEMVEDAFALPRKLKADGVYTDKYLPAKSELMLK